jgi:hypothetical protein
MRGRNAWYFVSAVAIAVVAVSPSVQGDGQAGKPSTPSRAAEPSPDLEGVWNFSTLTPLERPADLAGKPFLTDTEATAFEKRTIERDNRDQRAGGGETDVGRGVNDYWFERGTHLATVNGRRPTSLITEPPDGRVPAQTPDARAKAAARGADARDHPADGPENRSLQERCLSFNAGPPILPGPYNNYVQIFQFPGYVILFSEMIHDARIVPLDGRPPVALTVREWMGESRGRWDGNTLVVDTTNFNGKSRFRGSDENLHLVERFTRVNAGTLLYEFTVDDPTTFTKPWTAALPMIRTSDQIFEYACHEGNYALMDILRGARTQERAAKP